VSHSNVMRRRREPASNMRLRLTAKVALRIGALSTVMKISRRQERKNTRSRSGLFATDHFHNPIGFPRFAPIR
jgi:hypothetical protein